MAFVADDLGAWLVALLADAGRKRLTTVVLGSEQERALRQAATAAVKLTAEELRPERGQQAEDLAMVVSEVFKPSVPEAPTSGQATVLEALQAGIAGQLALLDDASLTGTGQSSADVLGVPGTVVAAKLTRHLLQEIVIRGSRGGPLFPLASQLNDDLTHLQGRRIEDMLGQLAGEIREALARLDTAHAVAAAPMAMEQLPATTAGATSLNDAVAALTEPRSLPALSFPAQLTQRTVPLSDGLRAGTLLAIEVQAHRELEQATVVMTGITGPPHAATIPPPARLYWYPARQTSPMIAQGASNLINVARVGPLPHGVVMDTPDLDLPWSLPDGQWQVELQLTAKGYPALRITAMFKVSPADGFPIQGLEWLTLTSS